MTPIFLTIGELLDIHSDQIERYGGVYDVRDMGLLASAAAMASSGVGDEYLHQDLFEMAAAYLFHIACNHPFVDGNKRTGAAAALVFLRMNDVELHITEDDFFSLAIAVACGKADKAAAAAFFREHCSIP